MYSRTIKYKTNNKDFDFCRVSESKIYEYDERILSYLSEKNPINPGDLIKKNIIYKKYGLWQVYEITAEKIMIEKHFEKFLKTKIIEKKNNGFILR